ncbi:hypothetical protein SLEP1_g22167 [Rubroshorea leprosula]|uniref:Uncharacterized protein n=1 Tax=Rubroshorea leprosula TaxID=152421 RepID=A0AAV5JBE8_9ROSI|nr:hypothetical protein SLEP1_g22167 [Rubroshorea leprosula]
MKRGSGIFPLASFLSPVCNRAPHLCAPLLTANLRFYPRPDPLLLRPALLCTLGLGVPAPAFYAQSRAPALHKACAAAYCTDPAPARFCSPLLATNQPYTPTPPAARAPCPTPSLSLCLLHQILLLYTRSPAHMHSSTSCSMPLLLHRACAPIPASALLLL